MFNQFSDRAREVMALANREAQRYGHEYISPFHVLLGMIESRKCCAHEVLRDLEVNLHNLKVNAGKILTEGVSRAGHSLDTKRIIEAAIIEAQELGHNYVGSEHLLLGLLRIDSPALREMWQAASLDHAKVRDALIKHLSAYSGEDGGSGVVTSKTAAEPVGPYPHARRVGNLLFLSGVGPRKRGSKDIPGAKVDAAGKLIDYDIEAEMRSCFENIRTILGEAGSRWENIVDVTVFLTDMKRDWQTYNRVYGEFFPAGPNGGGQPCRTTVEIAALPTGGNTPIHFEIKVVATV